MGHCLGALDSRLRRVPNVRHLSALSLASNSGTSTRGTRGTRPTRPPEAVELTFGPEVLFVPGSGLKSPRCSCSITSWKSLCRDELYTLTRQARQQKSYHTSANHADTSISRDPAATSPASAPDSLRMRILLCCTGAVDSEIPECNFGGMRPSTMCAQVESG